MSTTLQRARITDCPHGGKHNGVEGYLADSYADGTSGIDIGFDHVCITSGFELLNPAGQTEASAGENALLDVLSVGTPKRRGRPPKAAATPPTATKKRRGRPPKHTSEQASRRTQPPKAESKTRSLTISERGGQRFDIEYSIAHTSITATNASEAELEVLLGIMRSMGATA